MAKMRNTICKEDIEAAIKDVRFTKRLRDVQTLVPSNGGRDGLHELVAFYTYITEKKPFSRKTANNAYFRSDQSI